MHDEIPMLTSLCAKNGHGVRLSQLGRCKQRRKTRVVCPVSDNGLRGGRGSHPPVKFAPCLGEFAPLGVTQGFVFATLEIGLFLKC